ncbi:anthrone oxygenase family protein [Pseudonocardia sp. HH130630-07]|uniref:anthrone oxygenase family protein n=1 Tax=Pseudonocardia sp. HH130630-07 TaxID=1690815 RepID=UPI0008151178|nr:anthrone oxygenase family protein [Pseudonocardia sp. HH130630-07]ANY07749.1 hypothetical protein AFB00_17250 [Pseudonocardia sp. HH130630-07]
MTALAVAALAVTGFVSCAEFGSYAFVHPVMRRLPSRERIDVEKGLLQTFGRVMPAGMVMCVVVGVSLAVDRNTAVSWAAAASFLVAVTTTVVVNVPINMATSRLEPEDPPPDWEQTRTRWERYQAVRSWLLLLGFVLTCAVTAG